MYVVRIFSCWPPFRFSLWIWSVFVKGVAVMSRSTATQMRCRTFVEAPVADAITFKLYPPPVSQADFCSCCPPRWVTKETELGRKCGAFTFGPSKAIMLSGQCRSTICSRISPAQACPGETTKYRNLQVLVDKLLDKTEVAKVLSDLCRLPHTR